MSVSARAPFQRRTVPQALAIALCAGTLLAACAPADEPVPPADASTPALAPTPTAADEGGPVLDTPPQATGETVGGDGSPIELSGLVAGDIDAADLQGELACSFAVDGAPPILFAMGVVGSDDPSQGIVKVGDYVEPVRAPGGFNGMTDGATFSGQGKTIRIQTTGAAIGGGESPPRPATLTYQRADGASRTFDGQWQCGP